MSKNKAQAPIHKAAGLNAKNDNIRVVMPNPLSRAVSGAFGNKGQGPLVYDQKKEAEQAELSWFQLEDFSQTVGTMIAETAHNFGETITLVQSIGYVKDAQRFSANVTTTMQDLDRYTNEYMTIKEKHNGRHGFITEAEDRMLYLSIFEDYRSLAAYFQGTMHHKLIEFTEYALDAKDARIEAEKAAAAVAQPEVQPE